MNDNGDKTNDTTSMPKFRIKGKKTPFPQVIIMCSKCEKDIRPMLKSESLPVDRGVYCKDCDDGAIHLNMPKRD